MTRCRARCAPPPTAASTRPSSFRPATIPGSWAGASRSYYADLLAAGVKIHEYVGGLLHTKSLTVDGEIMLIGSANMDRRSMELNYENNILVYDTGTHRSDAGAPAELYRQVPARHPRAGRAMVDAAQAAQQYVATLGPLF